MNRFPTGIPGIILRHNAGPNRVAHTATCSVGEPGCRAPLYLAPVEMGDAAEVMHKVTGELYEKGWTQNGKSIWTCPHCLWAGWNKPIGKERA